MLAFLPALAPTVLGAELKVSNVATWWLGRADMREAMIEKLDSMVIASAFTESFADGRLGQRNSGRQARRRAARKARPIDPRPRHRLRRAGSGDAVEHAGVARRPLAAAAVHFAAVPGQSRRALAGHARRLRAHRRQRRCAGGEPAARRRHRRRLGAEPRPGRRDDAVADAGAHAGAARLRAIAEPRRRQSVLGRPLRGTRRGDAAAHSRHDQSQRRGRRCRGSGDRQHRRAARRLERDPGRHEPGADRANRARGADAERSRRIAALPCRRSAFVGLDDPRPVFARRLAGDQRSRHHDRHAAADGSRRKRHQRAGRSGAAHHRVAVRPRPGEHDPARRLALSRARPPHRARAA